MWAPSSGCRGFDLEVQGLRVLEPDSNIGVLDVLSGPGSRIELTPHI